MYDSGYYDKLNNRLAYISSNNKMIKSHMVVFTSIMIFLTSLSLIFLFLHVFIPSLLIAVLLSSLPTIIIELSMEKTQIKIGQEVNKLISTMARWSLIKDDLYYCLEKSLDHVENPLRLFIRDFLMKVKYSGQVDVAFQELIYKSKNESYLNLMLNLRQIDISKGDLPYLLNRLEEESFKIRGEQMRRASDTALDRTIIYLTSIITLTLTSMLLIFNSRFQTFYLESQLGRYLLTLYIGLYIIGFIVSRRINTFNY